MKLFFIVCGVVAAGELILNLILHHEKKKKADDTYKSIYRLIEERVLMCALRSSVTKEQASAHEYRSSFLRVEFPLAKSWMAQVFSLDDAITVGRNSTNTISIRDSRVSGDHCRIFLDNGTLSVRDMGSSNGTLVRHGISGKVQLAPQETEELHDGDRVIVSGYVMRVRLYQGKDIEKRRLY